jgi:NADH dehydrogenase
MRIVLLGSGYSAIWCYRALRRHLGRSADITVVAPFEDHVFHGFTGEVLSGDLPAALQVSPLPECLPHATRVRGWATAVDAERRTVTVEWRGTRREVAYDHLVVATGARERSSSVPGLAEHGLPLRFPGEVGALIDHLSALEAEPAADPDDARRRRTIVVAGGGFAGTEVAAALGRRYGGTHRVVLVSASPAVAPAWRDQPWMHDRLLRNLNAAAVTVLPDARVARVDEYGVRLASGAVIPAATVVATLGNAVPGLPGLERWQRADGLLQVDDVLRVTDRIWSAGDVAAVRTPGGALASKDAIWAIRAGTRVGRNIAREVRGGAARRLGFRGIGTVAAFAPGKAVARVYGIRMSGIVAWTVRAAFFLWYVPSRRTALRILGASVAAGPLRATAALGAALRGAARTTTPTGPIAAPSLFPITGGKGRPAEAVLGAVPAERRRAAGA